MSQTSSKLPRKPSALMGWHPTCPAQESTVIDGLNARQIALRIKLRNHYWLTECKPISDARVSMTTGMMELIDPLDKLSPEQVEALLCSDFGFLRTTEGWAIPDLHSAYDEALTSVESKRTQTQAAGRASAAARGAKPTPVQTSTAPESGGTIQQFDPDDF